ncbi:MAG: CD1247 N-terminal domain-containing protein [Deltaproteobacteria bacterium]
MSVLKEKVAYLRGMVNGLNLEDGKDQGKIINAIIDALDVFSDEFARLEEMHMDMQEQVDIIDEDLGALEEEIYEEDYQEFFENSEIEAICPHCDKTVVFLEQEISEDDEVECPHCHKTFEIEWECGEDCGCGCGECDHE